MEEFEVIRQARAMLKASPTGAISEETKREYKQKAARMIKAIMTNGPENNAVERLIAVAKTTRSIGTWFNRRAALSFSLRLQLEALLSRQDQTQRALRDAGVAYHLPDWDEWRAVVSKIESVLEWHTRLQKATGPSIKERIRRHSKRKDMRGLPDDWRERMVARQHKYKEAVLIQAVSGCRPQELVSGVKLFIEGNLVVAEIKGVKTTSKSGQPWRRLYWPLESDSELIRQLADLVKSGVTLIQVGDAKVYGASVRAASEREWPNRKKAVTPYCFRHAFASDMKCSRMEDTLISQALGHCVDVARSYYGHWSQGKKSGGVAPVMVKAARVVKIKKVNSAVVRKKLKRKIGS